MDAAWNVKKVLSTRYWSLSKLPGASRMPLDNQKESKDTTLEALGAKGAPWSLGKVPVNAMTGTVLSLQGAHG